MGFSDGPALAGDVRCDGYRPVTAVATAPVYVHFHGGAFIMRYPRMDDFFARFVAAETAYLTRRRDQLR